MLGESLVDLRRKDSRKDAIARDSLAPILDFVLRRPTPSQALKYLALRRIKLGRT
jgi:hypothetical protein